MARRRHVLRWVLGVAGVLVLALGALWVAAMWFAFPSDASMCANTVVARYPSPDAARQLVVFERDCGASTDFSTSASVLSAGQELQNENGNLFAADTDHGAAPAGRGGGPWVVAQWRDAQTLVLTHHPRARIFLARKEVEGVRVIYLQSDGKP